MTDLKRLERKTGLKLKSNPKDSVFGACYATDTSFCRFDADSGEVVLAGIDCADRQEEIPYVVFSDHEEYKKWFNGQLDDNGAGRWLHYGDISLAYRAAKNLGWIGREADWLESDE